MIERIQTWLDIHPRIRLLGRVFTAAVASLIYLGIFTAGFALIGAVVAGLIILIVNLAGPLTFTSFDEVWGAWGGFLSLGAFVGAIGGIIRTLILMFRGGPYERRSRDRIASDLIAQAVVAQRIGAESINLELGLLGGGDMHYSYTVKLVGGPSAGDQAFDRLTVLLANPSLTATIFEAGAQRDSWYQQISRAAEEIVIRSAAVGVAADTATLIASAAERARTILAEVDEQVMGGLRSELLAAGSIRSRRIHALMRPAKQEQPESEALVGS